MNTIGKNLKTINAHLSMDLVQDVLQFHNKGNLYIDKNFKEKLIPHTLTLDELFFLEKSDFEISPFYDDLIECKSLEPENSNLHRSRSAQLFKNSMFSFEILRKLLTQSFSCQKDKSRPYPSGGALYPVEVICIIFSEKMDEGLSSGFYHYRPTLNILQPIKLVNTEKIREVIYEMESPGCSYPNFAFLYLGVVGKMLVKYQYRGYRYACMEAGAMFQQADLVGQSLGLVNKLYSAFNDHEIIKFLNLDCLGFLPLVVQSFGEPA